MAVDLPPNNANIPQANLQRNTRIGERRPQQDMPQRAPQAQPQVPRPQRAAENYVPANESIATLVSNAVQAKKQGITWDRGSILNIEV